MLVLITTLPLAQAAPVHLVEQPPLTITSVASNVTLIDFGRVAFGNLELHPPAEATGQITVRFGEAFADGRIDRNPPGSVRYSRVPVQLNGSPQMVVAPPPDKRNTAQPAAVLTPREWGVVTPFRWVEIDNWPGELRTNQIVRRMACSAAWNDEASAFHCSDEMLNQVWDLCRYSIKATTFAGIYVDGDRERIAYEADAYLAQLSQYYTDGETQMARDTFDRLMAHPTWPTEWAPHVIFMAYADWMQTGDTNWLAPRYASLKSKLQLHREGADGLMTSTAGQIKSGDLVDWPTGERDEFVFTHCNTVVNAFHLHALKLMAELARALQQSADADEYEKRERIAHQAFQDRFFDPARQLYRDGVGTEHTSLHANLFPLAFGLVPESYRAHVTAWLTERGMACSVYAAQYLMEGLFENHAGSEAIKLMIAPNDRSWRHMVESGTTITWEAWDQRYKLNQDWNHAWGAAPANLLPRFVLGVQPAAPGWKRVVIAPNPGSLESATGKVPSPLGPIQVEWHNGKEFNLALSLPPGMHATVQIPATTINNQPSTINLSLNGQPAHAHRQGDDWILDDVTGTVKIEAR